MSRILVVDDKELMRDSVATTLSREGHTVIAAQNGQVALTKLADRPCDAVITDLQMPEMDGLKLLGEIHKLDEQMPVILMTAFGTIENAVEAMKQGAYDYITKPFTGDILMVTLRRALEHAKLVKDNSLLRATANANGRTTGNRHKLVGSSQVMKALRERLTQIADNQTTVLISGESGSGKEIAARWIHEHSSRADKPFLAINCAAISATLLESELFGHEKGSFTGADRLRKGRFELADEGTLLLDEISEIGPELQAKLLRVVQERAFERVGSSVNRKIDVRVIATTNRQLASEVARGTFREDLYYRLNVVPVTMPPLRSHRDDIPELITHFLADVAKREGKPTKNFEPAALELMKQYAWPGNVREMQNICERAIVLTKDNVIRASLIEPWLRSQAVSMSSNGVAHRQSNGSLPGSMIEVAGGHDANGAVDLHSIVCDGDLTLADVEREVIVATLEHNKGHRQRSASALGIGVRTLGLKLKKWKEQQLVSSSL